MRSCSRTTHRTRATRTNSSISTESNVFALYYTHSFTHSLDECAVVCRFHFGESYEDNLWNFNRRTLTHTQCFDLAMLVSSASARSFVSCNGSIARVSWIRTYILICFRNLFFAFVFFPLLLLLLLRKLCGIRFMQIWECTRASAFFRCFCLCVTGFVVSPKIEHLNGFYVAATAHNFVHRLCPCWVIGRLRVREWVRPRARTHTRHNYDILIIHSDIFVRLCNREEKKKKMP